jgi:hypothetical protein
LPRGGLPHHTAIGQAQISAHYAPNKRFAFDPLALGGLWINCAIVERGAR